MTDWFDAIVNSSDEFTDQAYAHLDEITTHAYERWQANRHWTQAEFWRQLSDVERFAVFILKFDTQVLNGGFSQWWYNRYATDESVDFIIQACTDVGTQTTLEVSRMIQDFWVGLDQTPYDDLLIRKNLRDELYNRHTHLPENLKDLEERLTGRYATIQGEFVRDCDTYLRKRYP